MVRFGASSRFFILKGSNEAKNREKQRLSECISDTVSAKNESKEVDEGVSW